MIAEERGALYAVKAQMLENHVTDSFTYSFGEG